MKKTMWLSIVMVFSLATLFWVSPCQAQTQETLQACAKIKKGQLRIVSNPAECKKSEYAVTINGSAPAANPIPAFAGKVCWNYEQTEDQAGPNPSGPDLFTAYVTYLGDGRYSVHGSGEKDGKVKVGNGLAIILGDSIYLSMPSSTQQTEADVDRNVHIHQIKLDTTFLDGTLWAVTTTFDPSDRTFSHWYTAGNLKKRATCP